MKRGKFWKYFLALLLAFSLSLPAFSESTTELEIPDLEPEAEYVIDRTRYNDLVSDNKRLERDKERVEELDARDADKLKRCSRIGERIRKREPETTTSE